MATSTIKSTVEVGTWTPHIYDLDTKVLTGPTSTFIKIRNLRIYFMNIDWGSGDYSSLTISSMLQIKNFTGFCYGGNISVRGSGGSGGYYTNNIQPSSVGVYPRPNITGTFAQSNNGLIAGFFITIS